MENISISKQLFRKLVNQLEPLIVDLHAIETDKWCGLFQKGGKRFAYILVHKIKPKIDIWCLGDVISITEKYQTKIKFKERDGTKGSFGKNFQINFTVENDTDIENAVFLLYEISNSWTNNELTAAFNLFCKIPLDEINSKNILIVNFANLIGKSEKEIAKRLRNFEKLGINKDIENIEIDDKNIWNNFNNDWEKYAIESENKILELEYIFNQNKDFPKGKERESIVKMRVNQNFFRNAVLTSYQNKCCITNLPIIELLNASHIMPWASDEKNRLNPHNGLCLNSLHDRAFDRGLLTVTPNYKIKISKYIYDFINIEIVKEYFIFYENKNINLPNRFKPNKDFLEYHNNNIFKG